MGGRGGSSHAGGGNKHLMAAKSFLENAYGKKYASDVITILEKAPTDIRGMWEKYGSKFVSSGKTLDPGESAYYSPRDRSVTLNIARDARETANHTKYRTILHEYGHMADNLIGEEKTGYRYANYSFQYKNGELFKTARQEVAARISYYETKYNLGSPKDAALMIAREVTSKYPMKHRADVSDMLEGAGMAALGIDHPASWGHGISYWNDRTLATEIFAEITSAKALNGGSLQALTEYFPKTLQVYDEMMKGMKKK